jgi:Uma2 family endonuclease
MTIIAPPAGNVAQLPPLPIYRFSVDQYHRMIRVGILGDEDPVELLEGLIVIKGNSTLAPAVSVLSARDDEDMICLPLPIRRFTVEEFHRMVRAGILEEEEPIELLEGWIVRKMPRNPPHDSTLARVLKRIAALLSDDWSCRVQSAITTDTSQPEPDLAVVRGPEDRYDRDHPRPRDVGLVIEVADTTLQIDRALKGPLYARVGIPVYWIVNIRETQVEVYMDPTGPDPALAYRQRRDHGVGATVPLVLSGQEIGQTTVRELMPS